MTIGEKITVAREKMNWTIEQLAEESGVKAFFIHKVEADMEVLLLSEAIRIADALKRNVAWFMDGKDSARRRHSLRR